MVSCIAIATGSWSPGANDDIDKAGFSVAPHASPEMLDIDSARYRLPESSEPVVDCARIVRAPNIGAWIVARGRARTVPPECDYLFLQCEAFEYKCSPVKLGRNSIRGSDTPVNAGLNGGRPIVPLLALFHRVSLASDILLTASRIDFVLDSPSVVLSPMRN